MNPKHAPTLFDPLRIGRIQISNRILMAPMTRSRATPQGLHHEKTALYYAQRASSGLIITEATPVSKTGSGYPVIPGLFNDQQEESWKPVLDAVHEAQGRIFIQLVHTGRVGHSSLVEGQLVAPSAIPLSGTVMAADFTQKPAEMPRSLTESEIQRIVAEFAKAAKRAIRAGADGVELHGANGYLIDQFLRDGSNHRVDRYGGSLENRLRFLLEICEAVSAEIGADRLAVRFSPFGSYNDMNDSDPHQTFIQAARALGRLGLAFIHVIEPALSAEKSGRESITSGMKEAFQGLMVGNGGYDLALGNAALARDQADAISFGVPYIANPDLVRRLQCGAPWNVADRNTFYTGGVRGYTDYPLWQG